MSWAPGLLLRAFHKNRAVFNRVVKPNRKVLILKLIRREANGAMNQSELEANTCKKRQARENLCEQMTVGLRLVG